MSGGVRGKEHEWSYKAQDGQDLKAECLRMTWSESVENRHSVREAGPSDSVGGLSCVSCVCTKVHMSTRTCVHRHHVWMTT
jgi:hypothetical protein